MTQRTAQNIHTATLLQIDFNTHISTNKSSHYTSLKFTFLTSLQSTSLSSTPHFHLPPLLDVSSPPFKTPSLLPTYKNM